MNTMFKKITMVGLSVCCLLPGLGVAGMISISEVSTFFGADELGPVRLQETAVGVGFNEFASSGISATFTNQLNIDNTGTLHWEIQNNSGSNFHNADFLVLLDAELDLLTNLFFNESGQYVDVSGLGGADAAPDSWEIDDPFFGDIYANILFGALDGVNSVASPFVGDVALALGFAVGDWLAGESFTVAAQISTQDIGGLRQFDPDSASQFYFNASLTHTTGAVIGGLPVSEPAHLWLMLSALILMLRLRARNGSAVAA